jgi:hypothetical protein
MRARLLVVCLGLLVCSLAAPQASAVHGDLNFLLGQKQLEDDALAPDDEGTVLGGMLSLGGEDWPVQLAVDVLAYGGDEVFDLGILEVGVGVRKIFRAGAVRPYVGGGIERVAAAVEGDPTFSFDSKGDGTGTGVWAGAGVFWRLGQRFNLGFDVRWDSAEVDIEFDSGPVLEDLEVGGVAAGVTLGFGW